MTVTSYIQFNAAGIATGSGMTPDGTVPANAAACTDVQAQAWHGSTWVANAIVYAAPATPSLAQQAAALLASGLAIVSTATSALSGTYPADPVSQGKLLAVQSVLSVSGAFPGGATTWPVKDASGQWHVATPAQFTAIALAVANFVAPIDLIMDGHANIPLPSSSATIP